MKLLCAAIKPPTYFSYRRHYRNAIVAFLSMRATKKVTLPILIYIYIQSVNVFLFLSLKFSSIFMIIKKTCKLKVSAFEIYRRFSRCMLYVRFDSTQRNKIDHFQIRHFRNSIANGCASNKHIFFFYAKQ